MSRLDRHVSAVQAKLTLDRFFAGVAWCSLLFALVVWVTILVNKLFQLHLPRQEVWFWSGLALAVIAALAYAVMRRPSAESAAVAIDQKLGLKEKISTALYIRPSSDPFAAAAVRDAEVTAERVVINYRQHFPFHFPRQVFATIVVAGLALWTTQMKPLDLFGREDARKQEQLRQAKVEDAQRSVDRALATVEAIPRAAVNEESIRLAQAELLNLRNQPVTDPEQTKRSAAKALQDLNDAIKQQINTSQQFADAKSQERMFRQMQPPTPGEGPVAEAHHAMVKGQFDDAVKKLDELVEKFDQMDEEQQEKASEQMQQLAQALQRMAEDPAVQRQMQQQMQQMGMDQDQIQKAQELMQQAAQGDQQAAQQMQQMAQQMMQQMNNGQGPTPQQQQQIQQMMNQLQAQANNQQTAQQMAQAAQQMAQAMQQQAQQGQQAQQQGQQQGQQQMQGQQMQQGMQAMRQQLQQMQAIAQDAQQVEAAQQAAQAGQAQAQDALNGGQNAGGQDGGGGQWAQGDIPGQGQQQGQWDGQAGPAGPNEGGIGAGDRNYKSQAPYTVKKEVSKSQEDDEGRILASTLIKDNRPIKGESTVTLKDVATAAQAEQTDEVDQERISPQAQKVVRDYFKSMESDAAPQPQPAPKP